MSKRSVAPGRGRVVLLHSAAPSQPQPGQPCNGCGVCCAAEPCPLGMLVSRRRHGRCRALVWQEEGGLYRCRMVSHPERLWPRLPPALRPWLQAWARRWISAASGCDASLRAAPAPAAPASGG